MSDKPNNMHKWMPVMYATYFGVLQSIAHKHGYALAVHGSFVRDMDLIAVPWTETASPHLDMLQEMYEVIGMSNSEQTAYSTAEQKPHGRIAYAMPTGGGGYVDISIIQLQQANEL